VPAVQLVSIHKWPFFLRAVRQSLQTTNSLIFKVQSSLMSMLGF
jgi:hypothetical protein